MVYLCRYSSFVLTLIVVLLIPGVILAQESASSQRASSVTVTATASTERVRITAPASVVQMHVEVFAVSGERLFDNEIRGGNVFDWHLQDGQAQRLAVGDYVCVVTVKNIAGRITQKLGTVRVGERDVAVAPAETAQLSPQQSQAIGPIEENSSWIVLSEKENQTTTVIAHDGTDGQVTRGRGALSFRLGNFFSGNDQEQMRLTEEGNLGIGTAEPKARLDVAGAVRARQGFIFNDGSTLSVNDKGALILTNNDGTVAPNAAGTGTQNHLAKWLETGGAGTLGDSSVTELANGFVGIGNPNPQVRLDVVDDTSAVGGFQLTNHTTGATAQLQNRLANNAGAFAYYGITSSGYTQAPILSNRAFFGSFQADTVIWTQTANDILFATNGLSAATERMRIKSSGNVGIGTPIPTAKLTISGAGAFNTPGAPRFDLFNTIANTGFLQHVTDAGLLQFATTGGATRMVIDPNGKVGIGKTDPTAILTVGGEGAFDAPGAARFDLFNTAAGTGFLQHVSDTGLLQLATTGGATRMVIAPNGNVGVGTVAPQAKLQIAGTGTNGYTLGVEGNVTQNLTSNGFVKAMLVVNEVGTIARCFNSTISGIGATAVPCGFIVDSTSPYSINFGFDVSNRFVAVTPGIPNGGRNVAANINYSGNFVGVCIALTNTQSECGTAPFTIIVY